MPPASAGEVVIQGPNVISGYENNPEANAKSFTNGWFRTGDQGVPGRGWLSDVDGSPQGTDQPWRRKDRAARDRRGPARVIPAVAEAVCFGVPHPAWGEEVAAAVVLTGAGRPKRIILSFCKERLADFKCPKKIHIIDAIPRTATGKIQRGAVAKAFFGHEPVSS